MSIQDFSLGFHSALPGITSSRIAQTFSSRQPSPTADCQSLNRGFCSDQSQVRGTTINIIDRALTYKPPNPRRYLPDFLSSYCTMYLPRYALEATLTSTVVRWLRILTGEYFKSCSRVCSEQQDGQPSWPHLHGHCTLGTIQPLFNCLRSLPISNGLSTICKRPKPN
ncbi:hypothetical protein ACRALDRAFT_212166 [Sodiomyces alcalophilus JCM 7366]|uniref:uncharacterized protein n=1 Tax=Sodiomyces alcalophilus JCM 7366 TaxID=591952 RepID=UPI0039B4819A